MVLPAMAPGRDLDPDPPRSLSSGTGQEGSAQGISGTWSGTLTGSDGETLPNSEFRFSPEGYSIFTYQTKSGLKEAVLTTVVETIKFVPPRGGVTYITVESLSVSPESVDYAVSMSHERAGGVLTQSSGTLVAEFSLAGNGLDVALMEQENTTVSQPGIVIPGDGSQIVYRGTLHKVD